MKPGSKYWRLVGGVRVLEPGHAYLEEVEGIKTNTFVNAVYAAARAKGPQWHGTVKVIGNRVVYAYYRRTDYMRPNLAAYPIVTKMESEQ